MAMRDLIEQTPKSAEGGSKPRLLVSVRNVQEAQLCFAGGADVIDVKEPTRGPLGAADPEVLKAIVREVAGRLPVTAAAGELIDWPDESVPLAGVFGSLSMLKVGLSQCVGASRWTCRLGQLRNRLQASFPVAPELVPVAYADFARASGPPPRDVLEVTVQLGLRWMMVDTFDKADGCLLEHLTKQELSQLAASARQANVCLALAGKIALAQIQQVAELGVDVVGLRGAVCAGGRLGGVSPAALALARAQMDMQTAQGTMPVFLGAR